MKVKKIIDHIYDNSKVSFIFWFCIGILITLIFYKTFQQPVILDRAYLIYMSQVIYRGDSLYATTTLGYTPLSIIIVGFFMKLGTLFSLDTIISARIIGILLYGLICGSLFILLKDIFKSKVAPFIGITLFCGIGYLQILSGINAEPKLWVLFFTILGLYSFNKSNWFFIGLFFAASAMCWHVASISLIACLIMLPWKSFQIKSSIVKFILGSFLATIPVIVYLLITKSWIDFWNQAILRKIAVEGEVIAEAPLKWLYLSIYPFFTLEVIHFIFGFLGFVIILVILIKNKSITFFKIRKTIIFLVIYTIIWSAFNSIEFQGPPDIIPMLLPITIFATYIFHHIYIKMEAYKISIVFIILFLMYCFLDASIYKVPYSYKQQLDQINTIKEKYGDPFVIDFEEYYTLLEKPMPTKFMRYASYEDFLITKYKNGCETIKSQVVNQNIEYIVRRIRKDQGNCANYIISSLTNSIEYDSFDVKMQKIPLRDFNYRDLHYSIYKINIPDSKPCEKLTNLN